MIQRDTLMKLAYDQLKTEILEGKFREGEVYSTQYFADYLNISRTPTREALQRLCDENLIEINHVQGVVIRGLSTSNLLKIMQLRSAIDSYCAYYFTEHLHEEDAQEVLVKLYKYCDQQKELLKTSSDDDMLMSKQWYELDNQFHCEICAYTKNTRIIKRRENIDGYIRHIGIMTAMVSNRKQESVDENYALLSAIEAGDPGKAYQEARKHAEKIYWAMIRSGNVH